MSFNVPYADMNYATFDDIQGAINTYQANQTPWYIPNDGGFLIELSDMCKHFSRVRMLAGPSTELLGKRG